MAQYGTISRDGLRGWVFTPPSGSEVSDVDFVHLLNHLASLGWRVVVAGAFLGTAQLLGTAADDLILEKS